MPSPYAIAYIIVGGLALVCLVLVHLLFERLASLHVPVWEGLGSPEFFSNLRPRTVWKVLRFLAKGDYRSLNDPALTVLSLSASALLVLVVAVSVYLQVVFATNGYRWPAAV